MCMYFLERALQGGAHLSQQRLLVRMAVRFRYPPLEEALEEYILADQKSRSDLAVLWVL